MALPEGPKGLNPLHDTCVFLSFSVVFFPLLRNETLIESFEK